jgi:CheY-like chemotaxis protein
MSKINKILIVDDDKAYIDSLKRILSSYIIKCNNDTNFEIFTANNGIEGINKARIVHPDMIFMDYLMPELDGVSAMKQLKNHHDTKDIFIVLMSGERYVDSRGCTFLKKPIRTHEVDEIVRKYLSKDVAYLS